MVSADTHARERMANGPRRVKVEAKIRTLMYAYLFMISLIIVASGMAWLLVSFETPRSTLAQKRMLIPLVALVFATTGAVGLVLGRLHMQQAKQRVGGMTLQRAVDILLGGYVNIHWTRAVLLLVPAFLAIISTMLTGDKMLLLVPAGCAWIMAWMVPTIAKYEKFAGDSIAAK